MTSIRRRLTLPLTAAFAVLLVAAGAWILHAVRTQLSAEFDRSLLAQARALVSLVDEEEGVVELDYDPAHMPEYEREDRPDLFEFWRDDHQVLLRSRRLEGDLPRVAAPVGTHRLRDLDLPDGRAGRLVQIVFLPAHLPDPGDEEETNAAAPPSTARSDHPLTLVVARDREDLDRLLAAVLGVTLAVGAGAVLLAVLLVRRTVIAGLRPLAVVARQVRALDRDRLGERIRLEEAPDELVPIVDQLNGLLERLAGAFAREQRFTGNVVHELKTPIAELRALAEVGSMWPDDEASVRRFFGDVLAVTGRMEGVIADLLLLARAQAGVLPLEPSRVDLRALLASTWSHLVATPAVRGHRLRLDVAPDLALVTDEGKLGIVVSNLLSNAVTYAPEGAEIVARGGRDDGGVWLELANPAAPLPAESLERLAEPFWQGDPSRSSPLHAGLGLAVAAELVRCLGLALGFAQDPGGTFHARLRGPAPAVPRGPAPGPGPGRAPPGQAPAHPAPAPRAAGDAGPAT